MNQYLQTMKWGPSSNILVVVQEKILPFGDQSDSDSNDNTLSLLLILTVTLTAMIFQNVGNYTNQVLIDHNYESELLYVYYVFNQRPIMGVTFRLKLLSCYISDKLFQMHESLLSLLSNKSVIIMTKIKQNYHDMIFNF